VFGDARTFFWGFDVDNGYDGWSAHQTSQSQVVDCTITNCGKSGFAHVDTSTGVIARSTVTGRSGAVIGIASTSVNTRFRCVDTIFVPAVANDNIAFFSVILDRCRIGTPTVRCGWQFRSCTVNDTYLNLGQTVGTSDHQGAVFNRCFGLMTLRTWGTGTESTVTFNQCVFVGPSTGQTSSMVFSIALRSSSSCPITARA
jgi:hypothetical protein